MAEENKAKDAAKAVEEKMGDLEEKLDKHSDKLPGLSKDQKNMLVGMLPWVIGAYGVLSVFWIMDLWDAIDAVGAVGEFGDFFGGLASSLLPSETNMWIALGLYVVMVVLIGLAFARGVLNKAKAGWNFMFYAMLVSVVIGVWWLFGLSELGNGRVIWSLVVGLGGLYGLFQVRDFYKK